MRAAIHFMTAAACISSFLAASLNHARHMLALSPLSAAGGAAPGMAPAGIIVRETSGAVTNSTTAWDWYSMATPDWARASNTAFSLWGGGNFAMYQWGTTAEYACQGAFIFEKCLAHSRPTDRQIAMQQLVQVPMNNDGKVWEASNSEWHVGHQGAWESNAEFLIMARLYAAHTGDSALFSTAPERLICSSADGGKSFVLAGVIQPGLSDAACSTAPSLLLSGAGSEFPPLTVDTPSAPYDAGLVNSGRLISCSVNVVAPFTSLAVPLTFHPHSHSLWSANVSVYSATGSLIGSTAVDASSFSESAWTVVACGAEAQPAGTYLVVLVAADSTAGAKASESYYTGASWITNPYPGANGGASQASYGNASLWVRNLTTGAASLLETAVVDSSSAVHLLLRDLRQQIEKKYAGAVRVEGQSQGYGRSLSDNAAIAVSFILALMSQLSAAPEYDVYVIPDPRFRGSLESDVNTGNSYYDLLKIGFASSYINLRVLEGLDAYGEMQDAGLIPSSCVPLARSVGQDNGHLMLGTVPCYTRDDISGASASLRRAIGDRFSSNSGRFVDWIGCACLGRPGFPVAQCGLQDVHGGVLPANSTCLNVVDTDFVPSQALAAKLAVPAAGVNVSATLAHFAAARDTGRLSGPGFWHTNLEGLETVSPLLWSPAVKWSEMNAAGFAVKSPANTGDWHMFSISGSDGYGEWPLNAENGGRFFTTSAMVWEAAQQPYPLMYQDWRRMVAGVEAVGAQLAAGDTSTPLSPQDPALIAVPSTDPTVRELCIKARRSFPNATDGWGHLLCDFYQDIGWGTPENGVALYSFVKGLLGLRVAADGFLSLLTQPAPACPQGGSVALPLPASWPAEVASVEVRSLSLGAFAGVDVNCAVSAALLNCSVAC